MRKTLSLLAIIAALSSSAVAATSATLTGGEIVSGSYRGIGMCKVTISDGSETPVDYVYGCYSDEGSVVGCSVTMDGGTIDGCIYGAYSTVGCADWGTVTFRGGEVTYDIYGGTSTAADDHANNNTVTISGGEVNGNIYGGSTTGTNGSANKNTVTISGGTVRHTLVGGYSPRGTANENTVTISSGEVGSNVYGGYSMEGNANNNTVTVSGGTIEKAVMGGSTAGTNGSASDNTVIISGGLIKEDVAGGYAKNGDANNNTVTISGGTIKGRVAGGYSTSPSGYANENTVNLVGEGATLGELTGSSFTISGQVVGGAGKLIKSNSTLNVYGKGITADSLYSFDVFNFYLTPGTQNGDTMLTLTGSLTTDLSRSRTVSVKCSGATQLKGGDKVNLIHHSGTGSVYVDETTITNVDIIKGVSATYAGTVAVSEDKKDLVLTLEGGSAPDTNDEALKSMTETRTDVAALVNAAADFMATTGVQQAKLAAKVAALTGKDGAAPFVALGGSSMRYNTGSHVDANGFNGALGVAKAFDDITLGIAGEYGISSYKSYVGSTSAKGDSKLYGGALLADWQDKQGWHAESAVRLGRTSTDYSAMTALGHTHYTDHASYQGIMLGGGKEIKVSRKCDDTVDLYARYFYSHTNGSNTTATSGESMHFSGVQSHRTMVGARYNHELTDTAVVYAGAAWMHEFNGDAHSVIGGFTAPSPSLEGDSGMVEIGTTFAPCESKNILLNLNVQGWTGVQRGISGGAGCTIKF